MRYYNILDEAEWIVTQHGLKKQAHIYVPCGARAVVNGEIGSLSIEVQKLVESLEHVYLNAIAQGDWERELLLSETIARRPDVSSSIAPEFCDESECVGRAVDFIVMAEFWLREANLLL